MSRFRGVCSLIVCTLMCTIAVALLPAVSFGATTSGFPSSSLWVSRIDPIEGETIMLYTVIHNSGTDTLKGTIRFDVDGAEIASKSFERAAGASAIESATWKVSAGTHSVFAEIKNASDAAVDQKTAIISIQGRAAPKDAAISSVAAAVGSLVASSPPAVATVVNTIVQTAESVRMSTADFFEQRVETPTPSNTTALGATANTDESSSGGSLGSVGSEDGAVLGVETERAEEERSWISALIDGFNRAMYMVARSAAFFYPLLALFILLVLYILGRRMRRGYRR